MRSVIWRLRLRSPSIGIEMSTFRSLDSRLQHHLARMGAPAPTPPVARESCHCCGLRCISHHRLLCAGFDCGRERRRPHTFLLVRPCSISSPCRGGILVLIMSPYNQSLQRTRLSRFSCKRPVRCAGSLRSGVSVRGHTLGFPCPLPPVGDAIRPRTARFVSAAAFVTFRLHWTSHKGTVCHAAFLADRVGGQVRSPIHRADCLFSHLPPQILNLTR